MNQHDRMAADAIIERIADGEATEQDWTRFRGAATVEPSLWQDLAEAQRFQAQLSAQVRAALAPADSVEAPIGDHLAEGLTRRIRVVGSCGGWLAAAALGLAWSTGTFRANSASLLPVTSSPDQALEQYLTQGQKAGVVIGEVPTKVLIQSRPAATGSGYEVIYVRQILERRQMPGGLYQVGVDDSGMPHAIPADALSLPAKPM